LGQVIDSYDTPTRTDGRPLFDSTRISHFFISLYLLFANFTIFLSLSPGNTRILHNLLGIFNKKCHKANTDGQGRGKKRGRWPPGKLYASLASVS